ncbi:Zn-dependent exopeptidase [Patellaria atrata CBS 101060]|uniref:Peptide hydrolase n=1 Tax=Patellaria atrata CBS 101060 TaxID=1346257 RepID=A0A9P4SAN9_9PEZI|nr:Zn-dependent exopeptidase [Patellaria atrata CBS 101060]
MKLFSYGILLTLWGSTTAETFGKNWVSSAKLQKGIKERNLMRNLKDLDKIAKENGGNRAFGMPGFAASRDYIYNNVRKSRKYRAWIQDFPANYTNVDSITFSIGETEYYVFGLTYSPSTSAEGITAPLVLGPSGEAACSVDGWADYDVTGKIAFIKRSVCPDGTTLAPRVRAGAAAGAAAVVLYTDVTTKVTGGTLSAPDPSAFVPAGMINLDDGTLIAERLSNGEEIEAYFQQTQVIETRITQNVFAETKGGDPNNVIMLGAHLDSVKAGAGINDDGSGTTLILELFRALEKFDTKNRVRFAWWGAEENGLVGSRYYTSNLNQTEAAKILLYLNFDMVSKGYFGVFDGDGSTHNLTGAPGSEVIERLFVEDLTSKGKNVTAARFTGGSDYASFMTTLNKPVGGLHTGTGVEQDPCYHQACDTIDNPVPDTLTTNAKAAAHVLSILAQDGTRMIPKSAPLDKRDLGTWEWDQIVGERHLESCGDDV